MGSKSWSTTNDIQDSRTMTAQAEGSAVLGDGATQINYNSDSQVTLGALNVARQVVADGLRNQADIFQMAREANQLASGASSKALELVSRSNESALTAINQAKTDGGQTERLAKIAGVAAAVISIAVMLFKK